MVCKDYSSQIIVKYYFENYLKNRFMRKFSILITSIFIGSFLAACGNNGEGVNRVSCKTICPETVKGYCYKECSDGSVRENK